MASKKRTASNKGSENASKKAKTEPVRRSQRNRDAAKTDPTNGALSSDVPEKTRVEKSKPKATTKPAKTKPTPPNSGDNQHASEATTDVSSKQKKASKVPPPVIDRPAFWVMKAEPESRIEKGKDVKFSIDDLAARDKEPWDGVRNVVARNNMKDMKKGEKAFFYHSNCKVPGIAGVMTIENESSVDKSAFDPAHPYYDEKSDQAAPKWYLVHVKFLKKLDNFVSLKELQKFSGSGAALENMRLLRMSRLSVSRVSKSEWEFICKELAKIDPESLESIA